jgi:hypothetical protein
MSPTFKNESGYRFSIFSNEEIRMHVHVYKENSSAKVWLEPCVELAENKGFSAKEVSKIVKIVADNEEEFKAKYQAHIRRRTRGYLRRNSTGRTGK